MKPNKVEPSTTDLLSIFLGAKVDVGDAEGLGSPSKWCVWSRVLSVQPHILWSPVVCWPFLSNSHFPTVTIVIHSMTTIQWHFYKSFIHYYHM